MHSGPGAELEFGINRSKIGDIAFFDGGRRDAGDAGQSLNESFRDVRWLGHRARGETLSSCSGSFGLPNGVGAHAPPDRTSSSRRNAYCGRAPG